MFIMRKSKILSNPNLIGYTWRETTRHTNHKKITLYYVFRDDKGEILIVKDHNVRFGDSNCDKEEYIDSLNRSSCAHISQYLAESNKTKILSLNTRVVKYHR